jgi:hypothetical protein
VELLDATPVRVAGVYTTADANNNGMPDSWEIDVFGAVDPARTTETDSDIDGMPDGAEFAAGTDAMDRGSLFTLPPPLVLGDDLRFRWTAAPGRSYRVESTTDFNEWRLETEWLRPGTSAASVLLPVPEGGGHRLYRLVVVP